MPLFPKQKKSCCEPLKTKNTFRFFIFLKKRHNNIEIIDVNRERSDSTLLVERVHWAR